MNKLTDRINNLIGGVTTTPTAKTAPVVKPTTPSIGEQAKQAIKTQVDINKNDKVYKSLNSKGKSYGSGFGG